MENKPNGIENETYNKGLISLKQRLEEIKKLNRIQKNVLDYFYELLHKKEAK